MKYATSLKKVKHKWSEWYFLCYLYFMVARWLALPLCYLLHVAGSSKAEFIARLTVTVAIGIGWHTFWQPRKIQPGGFRIEDEYPPKPTDYSQRI